MFEEIILGLRIREGVRIVEIRRCERNWSILEREDQNVLKCFEYVERASDENFVKRMHWEEVVGSKGKGDCS